VAVTDVLSGSLPESTHRAQLRRAVIASTVGTTIEWYDFLLYGTVTGLVFGKLFFPNSDPLVGVLQAFAVYAVGFVARPLGAAIFGHFGDRVGRKAVLIATLLITGFATFAVGLVPTYESIGVWGAVILTAIRFIQGIGVGGEWGGSVLLSMEWARSPIVASSLRGRSSVRLPDCYSPTSQSSPSVGSPATNFWSGGGEYRSC
jgi:MFS family permease